VRKLDLRSEVWYHINEKRIEGRRLSNGAISSYIYARLQGLEAKETQGEILIVPDYNRLESEQIGKLC
jgi:hypothetical protein